MSDEAPIVAAAPPRRSPWPTRRVWALALVTLRQGLRMRLWLLAPLAILVIVAADLSSERFDPVFDTVPGAVGTALLVTAGVAMIVGLFFATYSVPSEIDTRVAYTVATKPASRCEFIAGKILGVGVLLAALLGVVLAGAYVHIRVRAANVREQAASRLAADEARARFAADLNALQGVARNGPLGVHAYRSPASGPDIVIHHADPVPESEIRWALAETGMRLAWDLEAVPVREWLAAGPAAIRVPVEVRSPAGAAPEGNEAPPVRWAAEIVETGPEARRRRNRDEEDANRVVLTPSEMGVLSIPMAPGEPVAREGRLGVPLEGPVRLELSLARSKKIGTGWLFGAHAGSVVLTDARGDEHRLEGLQVRPERFREKTWLVGQATLPRQAAVFRFEAMPPGVLGERDVAVEAGFTLNAWGDANVETVCEAAFVNRATGRRQTVQFTPELYHPSLIYVDRAIWEGGPVDVRLECHTDDDFLGLLPESVRLRTPAGPFAWNLAKGGLCVWLFGAVLATTGVAASARFSWFVSILIVILVFIVSVARGFVISTTPVGGAVVAVAKRLDAVLPTEIAREAARYIIPVPDLAGLLPPESLHRGEALALAALGGTGAWALGTVLVLGLVGWLLYRRREVAA